LLIYSVGSGHFLGIYTLMVISIVCDINVFLSQIIWWIWKCI